MNFCLFLFSVYFQLQVEAVSDTGISIQTAIALVNITVVRNENGPIFTRTNYFTQVQDTITIGTFLIKVSASDNDGVSVLSIEYYLYINERFKMSVLFIISFNNSNSFFDYERYIFKT